MSKANHKGSNNSEVVLFDEVNDMLGQDAAKSNEEQMHVLTFKLTEMQKICKTL